MACFVFVSPPTQKVCTISALSFEYIAAEVKKGELGVCAYFFIFYFFSTIGRLTSGVKKQVIISYHHHAEENFQIRHLRICAIGRDVKDAL